MQLYLIRHGQSFVNLKEWDQGNQDTGLTELGQRQADWLATWLPQHVPVADVIYASTMRRARETAAAVAGAYGLPIRWDDRLREVGNNRLDHTPWPNDALPTYNEENWVKPNPFRPIVTDAATSETLMHFRTRIGLFVEEVVHQHLGQVVVAVCHGGVVESAFDHIFNIGPWRRCEIWDHNTAVTYFEFLQEHGRDVWRLHYHNRIDHIPPEAR